MNYVLHGLSFLKSRRRPRFQTALLTFTFLMVGCCPVSAQQSKSDAAKAAANPADAAKIAEVMVFEKDTEAAVLRGDTKFLEHALSDDFLFTHGDAWTTGGAPLRLDTKQSWIAYVSQKPSPYVYRELDSVQVELHGDIAITCGRYRYQPSPNVASGINSGRLYIWFERVYAKRNGQWQLLSHRTVRGPIREENSPK
jgi:hypothetical protein